MDKQVRKNRFELKFAIFFPFLPFPMVPMPQILFFPLEGFSRQQIVRNGRDRAESAVEERLRPLAEAVDDCREAYNDYKDAEEIIDSAEKLVKTWEKLNVEEKYENIRNSKTDVDANENQAKAWKRLEEGTHTKEDLTWLKHEKVEQWYKQKHDPGYSENHEKAESHWSGTPWTNTEDKK